MSAPQCKRVTVLVIALPGRTDRIGMAAPPNLTTVGGCYYESVDA